MTHFLLATVSLVILIPVIYFLPFGLTNKGKMTMILSAYLLALFGKSLNRVFELWQTALVLVLMIAIFAYIGAGRWQLSIFTVSAARAKSEQPFTERLHNKEQNRDNSGTPASASTEHMEQNMTEHHDRIADWGSIPAVQEAAAGREELQEDHEFLNERESEPGEIDVIEENPGVSYMAEIEELIFDKKENDLMQGESR
ncbi:hypothetical protein CU633_20805 [Bacillus sp. V3-13]|uniref:hypothetical protein n=1 Tax=Bacillus sp. V3-13 TaxID=2053728 RepID=UPI000C7944AA|nr:hypothetical protein [Bacillus sp. V3-13]PLR75498.1 hypothetical protein CU633_20805 [Bacillus sp. V3-13]